MLRRRAFFKIQLEWVEFLTSQPIPAAYLGLLSLTHFASIYLQYLNQTAIKRVIVIKLITGIVKPTVINITINRAWYPINYFPLRENHDRGQCRGKQSWSIETTTGRWGPTPRRRY